MHFECPHTIVQFQGVQLFIVLIGGGNTHREILAHRSIHNGETVIRTLGLIDVQVQTALRLSHSNVAIIGMDVVEEVWVVELGVHGKAPDHESAVVLGTIRTSDQREGLDGSLFLCQISFMF